MFFSSLFVTHSLVMIIICAKLFIKAIIHDKVMGQTRTAFTEAYAQSLSADCDFDLALTHRFVISICSNYLSCPTCMTNSWAGHEQV